MSRRRCGACPARGATGKSALFGARLSIGISEAAVRKIVLSLLTLSAVALLAASLPALMRG